MALKIFSVIGARPQFIKAAPLSLEIRKSHQEFLVHTGQHYDDAMSKIFFDELEIPEPDVNLNVGSGTHAEHLAQMIVPLEKHMQEQQPDFVIVYGDTNSTLAAALAASKLNIPIAHVEAGLRSYNRTMPEEINRVLTDHLSTWLFCSTDVGVQNLAKEGIENGVVISGDIMIDAVLRFVVKARATSTIHQSLELAADQPYALATIHRPANADSPEALTQILNSFGALEIPVIFPVHPRTDKLIEQLAVQAPRNLQLISPLGYLDMLALLDKAEVLITDSGGLQKEAYALYTPCVTVRPETEWVETVQSGWNRLVEPVQEKLLKAVHTTRNYRPDEHPNFYGDGNSARAIVQTLAG